MVTPIEIDMSAKVLIGEYGEEAPRKALERAAELKDEGATDGFETYLLIADAAKRLLNTGNDNPVN